MDELTTGARSASYVITATLGRPPRLIALVHGGMLDGLDAELHLSDDELHRIIDVIEAIINEKGTRRAERNRTD